MSPTNIPADPSEPPSSPAPCAPSWQEPVPAPSRSQSRIRQSVRLFYTLTSSSLTGSRKDAHPAQPAAARRQEAAMAAVWQGLVRGVHDADHRKLPEGGYS